MNAHEAIAGYELILAHFGMWPSFHDSEVHRIVLDRTSAPTLELTLRGWVSGPESLQEHDAIVRFLFEDVFDVQLEGFNSQNVLSSLNLSLTQNAERQGDVLEVELEHCYIFCAEFKARKASVLDIVPYVPPRDA